MRVMTVAILGLLGVGSEMGWGAVGARADIITYSTVSRSVSASTSSVTPVISSNGASGVWSMEVFAYDPNNDLPLTDPNRGTMFAGGGYAMQNTTLGAASISGTLRGKAWKGNNQLRGNGASHLTTTFMLAGASPCVITGSWGCDETFSGGTTTAVGLTLTGPGGTVYSAGYPGGFVTFDGPLSFSGVLGAGTYTLSVMADNSYANFGGPVAKNAAISFSVAIPAPGAGVAIGAMGVLGGVRRRRNGRDR